MMGAVHHLPGAAAQPVVQAPRLRAKYPKSVAILAHARNRRRWQQEGGRQRQRLQQDPEHQAMVSNMRLDALRELLELSERQTQQCRGEIAALLAERTRAAGMQAH